MTVKTVRVVVIALLSAAVLVAGGPRELAEEAEGVAGGDCPCAYTDTCEEFCGGADIDATVCVSTPESGYGCAVDPEYHPCGTSIPACANIIGADIGTACPE